VAGRPRTISDERILAAVGAAVGEVGPARLTLAHVARAAGVSTGAVAQRFGSKRSLLLRFARTGGTVPLMRAAYAAAVSAGGDPVDGLVQAVLASAGPELSPEAFANHLALLHLDLADPEFRDALAGHAGAVRRELVRYLDAAAAQGRLVGADVPALADTVSAVRDGTLIAWATRRDGSLGGTLRRHLEVLLGPYRRRADERRAAAAGAPPASHVPGGER
jgi:AcrR family transcriptional regulator